MQNLIKFGETLFRIINKLSLLALPNFLSLSLFISTISSSLFRCIRLSLSLSLFPPSLSLSFSSSTSLPPLLARPPLASRSCSLAPRLPFQPLNVTLPRVSRSRRSSFPPQPPLRCVPNDNAKTSWLKIPRGSPDEAFLRFLSLFLSVSFSDSKLERMRKREKKRDGERERETLRVTPGMSLGVKPAARGAATTKGGCNRRLYTRIIHDKYLRALARCTTSKAQRDERKRFRFY